MTQIIIILYFAVDKCHTIEYNCNQQGNEADKENTMLHFRESMEGMANVIEYTALEMVELARQRVYELEANTAKLDEIIIAQKDCIIRLKARLREVKA